LNQTLKSPYGFGAHGTAPGVLDNGNMLHLFATPSLLDNVALATFDGAGHLSRADFGNIGGVPKGGFRFATEP
jgi:hypothetical protein